MIRFFRALAWLRWRLLVNSLRKTRASDELERASRILQAAAPILLGLVLIPGTLLLALLGLLAGWALGTEPAQQVLVLIAVRALLAVAFGVMLLAPLLRAVQGTPPNLTRFLLLPIRSGSLYACEALASLGDPWLAVQVPAVLLIPVGLLAAGRPAAAASALLAGGALLAMLIGVGTLSDTFARLVFRDRRRGEILSVIVMIVVIGASIVPGLLEDPVRERRGKDGAPGIARVRPPSRADRPPRREWSGEAVPLWALAYPPELYVRALALGATRRTAAGLVPLALLVGAAGGLHFLSWKTYRRLLETPEPGSVSRHAEKSRIRWRKLPGLNSVASAVALAQVRISNRTVQGRINFWMPPLIVLTVGGILRRHAGEILPAGFPVSLGVLLAFLSVVFSVLTLESVILNQFASDRAGLTLEFLAPMSDRDLLRGKAAGGAILVGSRTLLCFAAAGAIAPGGPILLWPAALLAGVAVFLVMAPVGAILSTLFPKASDLNRLGQAGKPHPIAELLGMAGILLATGPAVLLVFLALFVFKSPALALLLVSGWVVAAAGFSIPLFRLAERLLGRRRENLAMVAQGR